jgi:hypothetical protein
LEEDNSENQTTNTTRLSFGDFNIGGSVVLEKQVLFSRFVNHDKYYHQFSDIL